MRIFKNTNPGSGFKLEGYITTTNVPNGAAESLRIVVRAEAPDGMGPDTYGLYLDHNDIHTIAERLQRMGYVISSMGVTPPRNVVSQPNITVQGPPPGQGRTCIACTAAASHQDPNGFWYCKQHNPNQQREHTATTPPPAPGDTLQVEDDDGEIWVVPGAHKLSPPPLPPIKHLQMEHARIEKAHEEEVDRLLAMIDSMHDQVDARLEKIRQLITSAEATDNPNWGEQDFVRNEEETP